MEIRDGFIISVFNYCDWWCETCALTSHCRVCADMARHDALGAHRAAVAYAAPHPQDLPPAPPRWFEDVLAELSSLAGGLLTGEELAACEPKMAAAHRAIYERAKAYSRWAHECVGRGEPSGRHDATDPIAVISWFSSLNTSKIRHALTGLAEFDGNREFPPDHEGSAKVALIGIERSQAAWSELVTQGRVSESVARPCIDELEWIKTQLEAAIPYAHAFVRPGFDEPDAVAKLLGTA